MMWFVYIVTLSHWWKAEHVDVTVPTRDWLTGQCYDSERAQTYEKTGSVIFLRIQYLLRSTRVHYIETGPGFILISFGASLLLLIYVYI